MAVYAIRGGALQDIPQTPAEEYRNLNAKQFEHFARVYLKDNIMSAEEAEWIPSTSKETLSELNKFFENIPDCLLDFSSDTSRKLLMMYITTNLKYGFSIALSEDEQYNLFNYVSRLADIDPRMVVIPS